MKQFVRADEGQALVVVGIAMVVLMSALVLTVDWGYGQVMRRAAQNQADAAVLAAAKLLGTSYIGEDPLGSGPMFDSGRASREQVWNAACEARNANVSGSHGNPTIELIVWFFEDDGSTEAVPLVRSSDPTLNETCAMPGNTPTDHTVFVSVRSSAGYTSLFGRVLTNRDLDVTASARARLTSGALVRALRRTGNSTVGTPGLGLSGASTAPNAALWPIALRYFPLSDPLGSRRIRLWPSDDAHFVSFAHFSRRDADIGDVHQLITESDYTQTNNADHHGYSSSVPLSGGCGVTDWDTNGSTVLLTAQRCDVPNWFRYGFRGSVSVGTDWRPGVGDWGNPSTGTGFVGRPQPVELPEPFPASRSSCGVLTARPYLSAPSCTTDSSLIGDWVETIGGVNDRDVAAEMESFINRYGRDVPRGGGGLEKAVVVNILLWDCGESFDGSLWSPPPPPPDPDPSLRNRWHPITPGGGDQDCSHSSSTTADRIHLFVTVPVLIRLSDVPTNPSIGNPIRAEWGDLFGDAGSCALPPECGLNPMLNSAFLVPEE